MLPAMKTALGLNVVNVLATVKEAKNEIRAKTERLGLMTELCLTDNSNHKLHSLLTFKTN